MPGRLLIGHRRSGIMPVCSANISRSLNVAMAIFLALCSIRGWAWAHAIVVDTIPKDGAVLASPPELVVPRFNARIEKPLTSVKLVRDDGRSFPCRFESSASAPG